MSNDNIFTYLLTLPPDNIDALYRDQWTCKSIFRHLSDLGKYFVMTSLFEQNINVQTKLFSNLSKNLPKHINPNKEIEDLLALRVFL